MALASLYELLRAVHGRRAFARGFWFGAGLFAFGVPWVYLTLARFGGMPPVFAGLAWLVFVAILAAYVGLTATVFTFLRRGSALDPWLFAALWTWGEWVRGHFLTGFPWFDLGYAASLAPLVAWAPLAGVLGLSFLMAAAGALTACALRGQGRRLVPLVLIAAVTPAVATLHFVHRAGPPLTASLIQGDISPRVKWDPRGRKTILRRYLDLTRRSAGRLVIWPETAVPAYSHELRRTFVPHLARLARLDHRHFLFGLIEGDPYTDGPVYNAVMSVGRQDGFYRKRHLVPFGEYLPWPAILNPVLEVLHIPMSSFTAWHGREPALPAAGVGLGLSICYEIAYGALVTQALPDATVLVNVSDDSWYGHSNESRQQLQIAQLRAAEAGRDMLIATNDGITALITRSGRIAARLAPFRPGVLTVVALPYAGLTPYDRFGSWPVLSGCALLVAWAVGRRRPMRTERSEDPRTRACP